MISQLLQPWLITENGFQLVLGVATRREYFAAAVERALAARQGQRLDNSRSVTERDGIATIPVEGVLFRHAGAMEEISGGVSYSTLRVDLQRTVDAYQRGEIKAAIVLIDSPGGEAAGCKEFCDALRAAALVMPIVAYVGGYGCSAAYWIASACTEIVCADTATLGSIGTVLAVLDDRGAQEKSGEKIVEFVSSVSPNKRPDVLTDSGRAEYQTRVDVLGRKFVEAVAANRGITPEAVIERYGQGGVRVGDFAVAAGLADRIGTYEGLHAELVARPWTITAAAPAAPTPTGRAAARANPPRSPVMAAADPTPPAAPAAAPPPADSAEPMALCTGCEKPILEGDPAYCATCAGKSAEAAANASAVARMMELTGAANADAALGTLAAAMESHRAAPGILARLAAADADGNRRQLRATLEAGLSSKRLTLGLIRTTVVEQLAALDDKLGDKVKAELAAVPGRIAAGAKESEAVLDAVCSVDPGAPGLRIVAAYAKNATPAFTAAHEEPVIDPDKGEQFDAKLDDETSKRIAAAAARANAVFDSVPASATTPPAASRE